MYYNLYGKTNDFKAVNFWREGTHIVAAARIAATVALVDELRIGNRCCRDIRLRNVQRILIGHEDIVQIQVAGIIGDQIKGVILPHFYTFGIIGNFGAPFWRLPASVARQTGQRERGELWFRDPSLPQNVKISRHQEVRIEDKTRLLGWTRDALFSLAIE
jgi:hypothetical protein